MTASRASYPSERADKFLLRLPDGLREKIAAAAKTNGRSMNAEIAIRLEQTLESPLTDVVHTPENTLFVVLDAKGFPISWPEIMAHIDAIVAAGKFSPDKIDASIVRAKIASSARREGRWFDLRAKYKKVLELRGRKRPPA